MVVIKAVVVLWSCWRSCWKEEEEEAIYDGGRSGS
jgi:hypothetical protein